WDRIPTHLTVVFYVNLLVGSNRNRLYSQGRIELSVHHRIGLRSPGYTVLVVSYIAVYQGSVSRWQSELVVPVIIGCRTSLTIEIENMDRFKTCSGFGIFDVTPDMNLL